MNLLVGLVVVLFVSASVGVLIWIGFNDGDWPGDVKVSVAFVTRERPETREHFAEITVDNPGTMPAMISGRIRAARTHPYLPGADPAIRTALRHPRHLDGTEFLGAVEGGVQQSWLLPIPRHLSGAVRATIVIDQTRRRTRVVSVILRPAREIEDALHDV